MPRQKASATATKGTKLTIGGAATKASPTAKTREQELEDQVAQLRAQLEAKPAGRAKAEYPEPTTPREVALEVARNADMLRDLHHLMVQRIPNTVTDDKPYGKGVLIKAKGGQDIYKMRPEFGTSEEEAREARNHYIKLGKLAVQVYGNAMQYRKSEPLTDEQIDGILRPALDFLQEFGLVNWEQTS